MTAVMKSWLYFLMLAMVGTKNYGVEDYQGRQYKGGVFGGGGYIGNTTYCDSGSAARFFYCAKANSKERNGSNHPTVKPIALYAVSCKAYNSPKWNSA